MDIQSFKAFSRWLADDLTSTEEILERRSKLVFAVEQALVRGETDLVSAGRHWLKLIDEEMDVREELSRRA
ncbi:hypothetical protein RM531_08155 [Salinisphaera sp. P385]|uniref:Antitoxin ParD1/3/4 n=1 Tax=Spectribacter acetivorans TaxID=3075603 RepID=A0ABU3B7K5_9GAMM|nr:hypothetical protein [Salinisphaera sp. P385]MDT0618447.1 hypothetical protein [Salinisphaera sp. P385]